MLDSPIDYDTLFKNGDKSWSLRLVDRIRNGVQEDELEEIFHFADQFDDFRMEAPLTQILEDASLTDLARDQASRLLCRMCTFESASQRRTWWSSGDAVLMRHAIRMAEVSVPEEAVLLETLASDPSDKLHGDAIQKLSSVCSETRFQTLKIQALSHPDAVVREKAADALYWDQPVCAEAALLISATDATDEVAMAALNTLCWYTSKNVLLTLHDLRCHGRADLFECYNSTFQWVLEDCLDAFRFEKGEPEFLSHYRSWLGPLWGILDYYNPHEEASDSEPSTPLLDQGPTPALSEKAAQTGTSVTEENVKLSVPEIIAELGNPDNSFRSFQDRPFDWKMYSETEQLEFTKFFLTSADYYVRKVAARAFAEWNETDALALLINDPAWAVRRAACYSAKYHRPAATLKEPLLQILDHIDTTSSFAIEVLDSYIVHADNDELDEKLWQLLVSDTREEVRSRSAWALYTRNSEKIPDAIPLLYQEPMLTWSLHATILEIFNDLDLRLPDLDSLAVIDDFKVQHQLARARSILKME